MDKEIKERIAAINSGIIPEGYKETTVGIVPVEWDIENLKELCEISSGNTPSRNRNNNFVGDNKWLSSGELKSKYIYDSNEKISNEAASELKKYPAGTVVIAIYGLEAEGVRGSCSILAVPCTISQACMAFEKFSKLHNEFFYYRYQFNGNTIGLRYAQGTKQQNLSSDIVERLNVVIPPLPEQQKIAEILSTQDKLIELQEKKIEQLKELKKAYLQKMFPQKGSNYPELRFKGFTDPWEQRKVGELTIESSEYATLDTGLPLLTSSRSGLMYQNEYRGKQTTDSKETLFSIVPLGACTYRHMSDDDVFHLNVNRLEKGLVSREYPVFYASENNNLDFVVQQINSSAEFRSFCAEQKKGGTRTRLYYKNLCEFQMLVPNAEEQEEIATFLLTLDRTITLHQRKLEQEKQKKKALMQLLLTGIVRTK